MKSISEIISFFKMVSAEGNGKYGMFSVHANFIAPTLHVDLVGDDFHDTGDSGREKILTYLLSESGSSIAQLHDILDRAPMSVSLLSKEEYEEKMRWARRVSGANWISSFIEQDNGVARINRSIPGAKFVHFYGYKGGQGRSTVLALLAKALADDGHKVLLVDADLEAPSLDVLFEVAPSKFSQTLMGLAGWADEIEPLAGIYSGRLGGQIDLIACRPRTESTDLDFALLTATAPLDLRIFERAAEKLMAYLLDDKSYDVVLVDHRTGIASSVLPLIHAMAGSAIVFARTDMNISSIPSELRRVVNAIFSSTSSVPGAFVSFSLDPNKSSTAELSPSEARIREALLLELAQVIERNENQENGTSLEENVISATDLSLNWVDWYLDRAMLSSSLPDVSKLQNDNIRSLRLLREAVDLPLGRRLTAHVVNSTSTAPVASSLSGAKDAGQFIHIPELDKLFVSGNAYSYVLGRKGTGKTRLLKEMANRNLGFPLLVASDETSLNGLRTQSIEANEWLERCGHDAPTFWWSLLRMRLEDLDSGPRSMADIVGERVRSRADPRELASKVVVKDAILALHVPVVFLVDGLETLVPAAKIKAFVIALFDLLGTIQNDPAMAAKLVIRAFIREDLASDSVQNIEQQLEGRSLRLKWSATSILNFALSRLPALTWVGRNFSAVCQEIEYAKSEIERSGLTEQRATDLMLRVFPSRLRRNNLSTATFLRLYFSDTGGDDTNKGTFYPRLYLSFLQKLDALAAASENPLDSEGRVNSALLNRAYDEASNEFIEETKQELAHLLALDYDHESIEDDATKVSKFIAAFAGLSTPFMRDIIVGELVRKTNFTEKSVRESLQRMRAIRMFEDRPGYGGWWRVGQLYKMGLMMKYVRGSAGVT